MEDQEYNISSFCDSEYFTSVKGQKNNSKTFRYFKPNNQFDEKKQKEIYETFGYFGTLSPSEDFKSDYNTYFKLNNQFDEKAQKEIDETFENFVTLSPLEDFKSDYNTRAAITAFENQATWDLTTRINETTKPLVKGRRKKKEKDLPSYQVSHTKCSKDNIRRKIKAHLTQFIRLFLNVLIKVEWNGHQKNKFRTLDNILTKDITIRTNAKLHLMTVKDFISQPVSNKFKCEKDQNAKTVEIITKLRPAVFNPIFEMKVEEFYDQLFCGNPEEIIEKYGLRKEEIPIKPNKFPKFFKDYGNQETDKKYKNLYIEGGGTFFHYFKNTTPRNRFKY